MCLSVVNSIGNSKIYVGYKYFDDVYRYDTEGRKLKGIKSVMTPFRYITLNIGEWYKSEDNYTIKASNYQEYPAGYHIFPTKRIAERSEYSGKLYKVEYKDILAEGEESGSKVIIARHMRVVSKVK
jgi:hypothetical protein